jgi:hypothetical protein
MGPKKFTTVDNFANNFATNSTAATQTVGDRAEGRRQQLLDAEVAAEDFTFAEIVRKSLIAMITKGYSNASQNISSLVQAA